MTPKSNSRRKTRALPQAEALETRNLLTGGTGNTFAIETANIAQAGGTITVPFVLDSSHFTQPGKRPISLGIDVAKADTTATVQPVIANVLDPGHKPLRQTEHLSQKHKGSTTVDASRQAVIAPVKVSSGTPTSYTVTVQGANNTSGNTLVGFYLPGDADGDGHVTKADFKAIRKAIGQMSGSTNYDFDADSNRDGKVTQADLTLAKKNLGASTDISPVVTANFTGPQGRVTNTNPAVFTGVASVGAKITYSEITGQSAPVSAVADASGNYTVTVPLFQGNNTFHVTSTDSFGQTIGGQISPVVYTATPTTITLK